MNDAVGEIFSYFKQSNFTEQKVNEYSFICSLQGRFQLTILSPANLFESDIRPLSNSSHYIVSSECSQQLVILCDSLERLPVVIFTVIFSLNRR